MGLTECWLAVHAHSREAAKVFKREGFEQEGPTQSRGWVRASKGGPLPGWDEFDQTLDRVSRALDAATLGGWVFDSSVGYVAAVLPSKGVAVRMVLNEQSAREYGQVPKAWRAAAAPRFVEWSEAAPKQAVSSEVLRLLRTDWVFVDEGVEELFEIVGLALPYPPTGDPPDYWFQKWPKATRESVLGSVLGGYEAPLYWMSDAFWVAGRDLPWRSAQYVLGLGKDFVGVWDRHQPAGPVLRFRRSLRGDNEARQALDHLLLPVLLKQIGADHLPGFEGPLDRLDHFFPGGRRMLWREARFIPGFGSDFVGVWDRTNPDGPIKRFKRAKRGENAALRSAYRLQEQHLLRAKIVHRRRWRALGRYESLPRNKRGLFPIWLITEEEPDETWQVHGPFPQHGFFVYRLQRDGGQPSVNLVRTAETLEEAQRIAAGFGARDAWSEMPSELPPTLFASARWALENPTEEELGLMGQARADPEGARLRALEERMARGQAVACTICSASLGVAYSLDEQWGMSVGHMMSMHPGEYDRLLSQFLEQPEGVDTKCLECGALLGRAHNRAELDSLRREHDQTVHHSLRDGE